MLKMLAGVLRRLHARLLMNTPAPAQPRDAMARAAPSLTAPGPVATNDVEMPAPDAPDACHTDGPMVVDAVADVDAAADVAVAAPPAATVERPPRVRDPDALWIDRFISKKREEGQHDWEQTMVRQLRLLPTDLTRRINMLQDGPWVPPALLAEVWRALEGNTDRLAHHWQLTDTDVEHAGQYGEPDCRQYRPGGVDDAGVIALGRFQDVPLVRKSALPDMVRSRDGGPTCLLHANHVDLGDGRRRIASQKPVAGEIAGFHQMLRDQGVALIVDLTRYREGGPADGYVPDHKGRSISTGRQNLVITCRGRNRLQDLAAIEQQLQIHDGMTAMPLARLQFPGWPDHGVVDPIVLIALADRIDALSPDPRRPILVHCMAGMGRTGTLMTFMAARRQIAREMTDRKTTCGPGMLVRIATEVLARGRIDRGPAFVQTEQQFILLVNSLATCVAHQTVQST